MNKENKLNAKITIIFKEMKNLEIELTSDQLSNKNNIKILNNNNNAIIELNLKSITSSFFSLKTRNIFDNFNYSFEMKYSIFYLLLGHIYRILPFSSLINYNRYSK